MNYSMLLTKLCSVGFMVFSMTGNVYAHAQLIADGTTPPRYNTSNLKSNPPCGNESSYLDKKTDRISIFESGQTINVQWREDVRHYGKFLIDFSSTGTTGNFENLLEMTDPDNTTTNWSSDYTLPAVTCGSCILRLRQDMSSTDIGGQYFSCADIILVSGTDTIPPTTVSNVATVFNNGGFDISWERATTDTDYKATLVVRSIGDLSEVPANRRDYLVDDTIGSGVVVYKGDALSFMDSQLQVINDCTYTYTLFSYDNDYNYDSGAVKTASTQQGGSTGTPAGSCNVSTGGGSTGTSNTKVSDDGGSGALSWWWLLAGGMAGFRRAFKGSL